jgi:hypothetical protein
MLGLSYSPAFDERFQGWAWENLGAEEGDLWAGAPGEARFPGLAADQATLIDSIEAGAAPRVGFLAVPQGDERMDDRIDWVREQAVRMKVDLGCITEDWNPFLAIAAREKLCHLETIDLRFYDPGYLRSATFDVFVVFLFPDAFVGFDPPYESRAGEPLPEVVYARNAAELDAWLAPHGLVRVDTTAYRQPAFEQPVDVLSYVVSGEGP